MEIGAKFKVTIKVEEKDTAMAHGSGTLAVLATPRMIALMEESAYKCIDKYLEEGQSSVGTYLDVKHLAATPVGMMVTVESVVTAVDGRKVSFEVAAFDEAGLIGKGTHDRFVVNAEKFTAKTNAKKQ